MTNNMPDSKDTNEIYDLIIIGGGPGGLTAGIYAQRARLKTLLIEKDFLGGQIALSDIIENYPGFPSISGADLMAQFEKHARDLDLEIKFTAVEKIEHNDTIKTLHTTEGVFKTRSVIISTGAHPKLLGVPGEKEMFGKGVSSCATCDGPFFKGQEVLVVGGGDTAIKDSAYLSRIVDKVTIVHRRDELRAEKILQEKVLNTDNVEVLWSHTLKEVKGDKMGVESVIVTDLKTKTDKEINVKGVFIFIGIIPNTDLIEGVEKDQWGFIKTNSKMETSVEGIYAIGDCRDTPLLQVASAVGDGSIAACMATSYLEGLPYME